MSAVGPTVLENILNEPNFLVFGSGQALTQRQNSAMAKPAGCRAHLLVRAPLPGSERLQPDGDRRGHAAPLREQLRRSTRNADPLSRHLFSYMDYVAVAVRL